MDAKLNFETLVRAIGNQEISQAVGMLASEFQTQMTDVIAAFLETDPTPESTMRLENDLHQRLREIGRQLLQWLFSQLEPELEEMPRTIEHQGQSYRRLAEKTKRADLLTRFGKVSLMRGRYRRGQSGRTIFPLETALGIVRGFTPAAADRVGKQFAATGSSQGRTLERIHDETGERIGTEKLRGLISILADGLEPFRQEAQVEKLMDLIEQARRRGEKPVLSVSRDGVALGLAPWSWFEMASVACVSVLADGTRLGTVYLGRTPESNQQTLSAQLTDLLRATVRRCGDRVPEIVYVTDAGKVETAYWKNTLRKFFVDGVRIKVTRVVDYYHAAERLSTIADALNFHSSQQRDEWCERVRGLLLEPGGVGRVLRSVSKVRALYGYKSSLAEEAQAAEKYLRRYRRFMNYSELKEQGYPIGSGVVESACKQIVNERMKLAGMRWNREGGQQTMTLRCLLLSGIWETIYKRWLQSYASVSNLIIPATP